MGGRRHLGLPLIVLLVGLLASLAVSFQLARVTGERSRARFDGLVESVTSAINARIDTQTALLRSLSGLFATDDAVSPEEFRHFVAKLDLKRNYPSVQGMGYSRYAANAEEKRSLEAYMRGDGGVRDFHVWPDTARADHSAILYLQPSIHPTPKALGFDMLSEPVRREALLRSARTGRLSMSGKIPLLPGISSTRTPTFLMSLPIYQNNPAEADLPASRRTLRGWIYTPVRAPPLFESVFGKERPRDVAVAIYTGRPEPRNLLFEIGEQPASPRYRAYIPVLIAGQPWTTEISSTPRFDTDSPLTLPIIVGGGGIVTTLLLSALALLQARTVSRTESRVEQRTAELSAANIRLIEESASREAAEAQLRQMQKMEAVGQLTGGVAHDFNNMLAVVMGSLDLARRRIGDPEKAGKLIDQAMEGTTRAATLTQRLLAFARRQALHPQSVDANHLIADMSELLQRTLGETIQLDTTLANGLWLSFIDAGQLENAIVNLAVNARDAMPEGGRLMIETANRLFETDEPTVDGDLTAGDYVMISVADTGMGMSGDVKEKAFDPFFTTKSVGRGTGLGLSQVFGFVKQSGGHLTLASAPGRGTTVTLYLPRFAGTPDDTRPKSGEAAVLLSGNASEAILVVEDEERVRRMSIEALTDLDYTVLEASSGREAIKVIETHPEIALVFTDVVMPDMDGPALARVVRERWPDIRLLFTTGYAPGVVMGTDTLDSDAALLSKPFTIDQLAARIRATLDG
jgi:signal transduction histidine kinase/CheY-like chemotaxis protein